MNLSDIELHYMEGKPPLSRGRRASFVDWGQAFLALPDVVSMTHEERAKLDREILEFPRRLF